MKVTVFRTCLGLPSLVVVLAENQRSLAFTLQDRNAVLAVEVDSPDFDRRLAECGAGHG